MATSYPTGLDTYSTLVDNVDDVLAAHANDRGDAIEALEIKVGIDSSAVVTTIDYFLKNASGAYRTHTHDGTSDDGANIPNASLTQITTAGKVSGAALTLLPNIPSAAGIIPTANIDVGTTASKIVQLDGSAKLPAVDGSQLTGISAFTDRGDPSSADYTVGSLTTDNAWHSLDISGVVPAGAKAVLLYVTTLAPGSGYELGFRKNGNSNSIAAALISGISSATVSGCVIIPCSTARVIDYKSSAFTSVTITIGGWF